MIYIVALKLIKLGLKLFFYRLCFKGEVKYFYCLYCTSKDRVRLLNSNLKNIWRKIITLYSCKLKKSFIAVWIMNIVMNWFVFQNPNNLL